MKLLLSFLSLLSFSMVEASGLSPLRQANESFFQASHRVSNFGILSTPAELANPLQDLDIQQIPQMLESDLEREYKFIRDSRFLKSNRSDFPRRITWLFPDDGCYARADIAAIKLIEKGVIAPKKIFAFGNLVVQSPNSLTGLVTWWYHVALTYRVDQQVYVLDPALEPHRPLLLQEWNTLIGGESTQIFYSICAARTYDPDRNCENPKMVSPADVEAEQSGFFKVEWTRLTLLNRDPEQELGDHPPWLKNQN